MPKEYTPAKLLECDHGDVTDFDGNPVLDLDGNPIKASCPGFCPKLVIKSWAPEGYPNLGPFDGDGKSVMHAVIFTAGEVRRLLKEADEGYFDLPDMPLRKDSRFWDPLTAMLMESLQTSPVRALGILLFLGQPQAVAYTSEPEPILALQDPEGEWLWIHLNGKAPDEPADIDPAFVDDVEDTPEIPAGITAHNDQPPAGATILWQTTTPTMIEETRYDLTDNGNAAITD